VPYWKDWAAEEPEFEVEGPFPDGGEVEGTTDPGDPLGTQVEVPELEPIQEQPKEEDPKAIDSDSAYMVLILQREKRFNSVDVLRKLELPQGGKAHMDIPLYRMGSLQVVRLALINDIQKLQADFVHGYRVGAAMFYVSLTNEKGEGRMVTDEDQATWNVYWKTRDREFEAFLQSNDDLKFVSNRMFFVWDGNHRLLAWSDHIYKVHRNELSWHYRVRSIVLHTQDAVTDTLNSMHDINKATENSHVKSNLVHMLYRINKVGQLPLSEFTSILTPEEMEQAKLELNKPDKKTWIPIPRAKFLEYIHNARNYSLIY
jgi:hypothetical protein